MAETESDEVNTARSFTTYQSLALNTRSGPVGFVSLSDSELPQNSTRKRKLNRSTRLYILMGDEADEIITSFGLSEQEMKSYETVRNRLEDHFIAKRNVIFKRAKFNVRIQDTKAKPSKTLLPIFQPC